MVPAWDWSCAVLGTTAEITPPRGVSLIKSLCWRRTTWVRTWVQPLSNITIKMARAPARHTAVVLLGPGPACGRSALFARKGTQHARSVQLPYGVRGARVYASRMDRRGFQVITAVRQPTEREAGKVTRSRNLPSGEQPGAGLRKGEDKGNPCSSHQLKQKQKKIRKYILRSISSLSIFFLDL